MRVGGTDNAIALNTGESNLHGDVLVGETHYQTVLGRVILVLILEDKSLSGIIIGLSLPSPTEFHLVALIVLLVLDYLHETLKSNSIE